MARGRGWGAEWEPPLRCPHLCPGTLVCGTFQPSSVLEWKGAEQAKLGALEARSEGQFRNVQRLVITVNCML